MTDQRAVPYLHMRGGTSKGPVFDRKDLPEDRDTLAEVLAVPRVLRAHARHRRGRAVRTARKLASGHLHVPAGIWPA